MQPVQITIRGLPESEALENIIQKKAKKLTQFYQHINSCRVVVDRSQNNKHQGKLYTVSIEIAVPGKELVSNHKEDEDIYIAIRDAFNAAERQLEKYARRRRGDVKNHVNMGRGEIEEEDNLA